MSEQPLLLDTCAIIWLLEENLDRRLVRRIGQTRDAAERVGVSPVSALEVARLFHVGRIRSMAGPEEYFEALLSLPYIELMAMPPRVLIRSISLPGDPPKDPSDRILAATAREFGRTLVTRDRGLLAYAAAGHLSAIAC